jgi:hypothetical protein
VSSTLDNGSMAPDRIDAVEAALRRLPEAHSLALRLKTAGVADEVVCDYLHIEPEGLDTLLRVASEKLHSELGKR